MPSSIRYILPFFLITLPLSARTLYVAPDGSDASADPSNIETPFQTIQQAATVAVAGDTVLIREGVYRETVIPANSGEAGNPITFGAYADESVTVTGSENLLELADGSSWQVWRENVGETGGNIYVLTNLNWNLQTTTNMARQLFINGKMMVEAQFPNLRPEVDFDPMLSSWVNLDWEGEKTFVDSSWESGKYLYECRDAEFVNMTDVDGNPIDLVGMTFHYLPRHNGEQRWGHAASGIISEYVAETGEIRFHASNYVSTFQTGNPAYIANGLGLLDAPGEWFYDEVGGALYFYPPHGQDPSNDVIEGKVRDYAFQLHDGGLTDGFKSYITVQDLDIFAATITTDIMADDGRGNGNSWPGRQTGPPHFNPEAESYGVVLERLHFKYTGHMTDASGHNNIQWMQTGGVMLSGFDHVLRDSIIEYSPTQGVVVIGRRNLVENNQIHTIGYRGSYGAGVSVAQFSWDNTVRHNTIWRTGNNSVRTEDNRWSGDPDHPAEVAYNRIQAYGMVTEDVGAIKDVGGYLDEPYEFLASWHHNIISHGAADDYALYLDYIRSMAVHHNIVIDSYRPININNGITHQIYNNTLIGYANGIHFEGLANVDGNDIRNNIHSGILAPNIQTEKNTVLSNLGGADESFFVNLAQGDLRLRFPLDIEASEIPEEYADPQVGDSREIGAIEVDGEAWLDTVGSSLPALWEAPTGSRVSRNDLNQVVLSWTDNADNETAYFIERAFERTDGDRLWEIVAMLPTDSESWVDLESSDRINKRAHYRVRANHSLYDYTTTSYPIPRGLTLDFESSLEDEALQAEPVSYFSGTSAAEAAFSVESARNDGSVHLDANEQNRIRVENSLEISPTGEFSVMLWVRPDSWKRSVVLFIKEDAYEFSNLLGQLRMKLGTGGRVSIADTDDMPVGNWYHIAVVFDGASLKFYMNGELMNESVAISRGIISEEPLFIGGPADDRATDSNYYFDGLIDDFRVYQKDLAPHEILAAYESRDLPLKLKEDAWNMTVTGPLYGFSNGIAYSESLGFVYQHFPWVYSYSENAWLSFGNSVEEGYWYYHNDQGWLLYLAD